MTRPRGGALLSRDKILAQAIELMTEQGFAATSLRQIARRLDVSVAALYYHYPAKDDLLREIVAPYLRAVDAILADAARAADPVECVLSGVLDLAVAETDLVRLVSRDPAVLRHSEQGPAIERRLRQLRRTLSGQSRSIHAALLSSAALGVLIRPAINVPGFSVATARATLLPAARRVLAPLQGKA